MFVAFEKLWRIFVEGPDLPKFRRKLNAGNLEGVEVEPGTSSEYQKTSG